MGIRLHAGARSLSRALVRFSTLLLCLVGNPVVQAACPPDRLDTQAQVRHVIDGDTLILSDNRHIRLIGINTPELGRDGKPPQSGADRARRELRQLVNQADGRIGLRYGSDRKDRYGRTLAHAFLPDGRSLSAELLARGLGFPVIIAPNTWHHGCYQSQAEQARRAGLGVWSDPAWAPRSSYALAADTRGFQRIIGVIERVGESRSAVWLNLAGNFAIRIPREDLGYFPRQDWNQWRGRRVEVSGWVYRVRDELRMNVHHPDTLQWLQSSHNLVQ